MIREPGTWQTGTRQELTTSPSRIIEQAPHSPSPQPSFVPVSLRSSRITSSSRFIGATSTRRTLPLTLNSTIIVFPDIFTHRIHSSFITHLSPENRYRRMLGRPGGTTAPCHGGPCEVTSLFQRTVGGMSNSSLITSSSPP